MARILTNYEIRRRGKGYSGKINMDGLIVKYQLAKSEEKEGVNIVKVNAKDVYSNIPITYVPKITKTILEGIVMCILDLQREEQSIEPINDLGITFAEKHGEEIKSDPTYGEYDITFRIPKRIKMGTITDTDPIAFIICCLNGTA